MKTYFIEEIENELNVTKRQIYLYIRRQGFLKKFGLKKMADLEDKPRNGSISKVLTEDMYHYLKSKLSGEHGFRKSDDDVKDVVYLVQLHFGFVMKDDEGNEQRRYKLGFTSKWLHSRESNMKVTNPEARVVEYWKMSRSDEQTLFKYVNGVGCNRIGHSEVFDVTDFDLFLNKINEFYNSIKK